MKSLSGAKSIGQCFVCREWRWSVCAVEWNGVELCLPCYVDALKARGVMGAETRSTPSAQGNGAFTPESDGSPGNSPSPHRQMDLFDA